MSRLWKMLLVALVISIGAQFSLNLFVDGFIITLSIIILPVLLYKNKALNPIWIGALTALVSPLIRALIMMTRIDNFTAVFQLVYPDISFYLTYGLVFYMVYWRYKDQNMTRFLVAVILSDFLSNLVEMGVRTHIVGMDGVILKGLVLIAFGRMLVVFGIVVYLKWYKSFLVREEHEIRYRKLMTFTSTFKAEVYFMQQNMMYIERIMKKSYTTYKRAETEGVSAGLRDDILDITKDVHEIKKDYIRVIQGLEQAFGDRTPLEKILISDLVQMLDINTHEYIESAGLDMRFKSRVDTDRYVVKHYYLMSILRNLVNNAIEASQNTLHPHIELRVEEVENDIHFRVSDNGEGMDSDLMDYVFNPGFSTKFDEGTGDICRGIGLTLVESLVQDTFGGSVNVDSVVGEGTTFTVCIPVEAMEVG